MGKPLDPAYWCKWRKAHPEYRARQKQLRNARRQANGRGDRSAEYAARRAKAAANKKLLESLPLLYPELQLGNTLSFWEDELRLDLAQEACLAMLEGKDTGKAVSSYLERELAWKHFASCRPNEVLLGGKDDD